MDRTFRTSWLCSAVAVLLLMLCSVLREGPAAAAAGRADSASGGPRRGSTAATKPAAERTSRRKQDTRPQKSPQNPERRPVRKAAAARQQERGSAADRKKTAAEPGSAADVSAQAVAARSFAAANHPELIPLLDQLEQSSPRQYQQAVGELARSSERFQRMRQTTPGRYETALAGWKLDSRIRLLAARMSADDSPRLAEDLRHLLQERLAVRQQELTYEHDRLTARLEQVQQLLDRIEADPAAQVERDFLKVQRMLRRKSSSGRPARPAGSAVSATGPVSSGRPATAGKAERPRTEQSAAQEDAPQRSPVVAPLPQ